jgi:hypothetical protein
MRQDAASVKPRALLRPLRLVGQLSNLSSPQERVLAGPARADGARRATIESVATRPQSRRLGNGVVQRAVVRALEHGEAMRVADIWAAVERLLGVPVSYESVSWCLRMGSRKEMSDFIRPTYDYYQLGSQT